MNQNYKNKLNEDIDIIVSVIHKLAKSKIVSIILYGSYGRDEGAFYNKNGRIYSYNDYDILLIALDPTTDEELRGIKQTLLHYLDVRWIDISQIRISDLKSLKPTIFNFDLKYGSKTIWGDNNVLNLIPAFTPKQLTLRDAETLYFTRLYTFLGSLERVAFDVGTEGEESRFFRNQMAKAVLAIVDVLLLQKNMYHTSYRERVNRVANIYPHKRELIELSSWALEEKMNPKAQEMNSKQIKDLHSQVIEMYLGEMFIALSKYYVKKIVTTDDLWKAKFYSSQEFILKIKILLLTKTLKHHNKRTNILFAQSYAVESFITEGIEKDNIIKKCKTLLKKIDANLKVDDLNWNSLMEQIVKVSR